MRRSRLPLDVPALLTALGIGHRRTGREWVARCPSPAHNDRDPSWQINNEGRHVCYSCGFGGGPVVLVQAVHGIESRSDAWQWLANFCGVTAPRGARRRKVNRKVRRTRQQLNFPGRTFALWRDIPDSVRPARDYVLSRGFRVDELEHYAIGAVPPTRGLPYAGRVILPVVVRGELVNFVARLYVEGRGRLASKVISARKDKGARHELSLWGYDDLDPDYPVVHVVEGVWGAIAAIHAGVPNVVSCCGSSWTPERTALLAHWPEVVLIPDGDRAGAKLEQKASDLRYGHRVRVVDLPDGTQPDDLPEELPGLIRSARPAEWGLQLRVKPAEYNRK